MTYMVCRIYNLERSGMKNVFNKLHIFSNLSTKYIKSFRKQNSVALTKNSNVEDHSNLFYTKIKMIRLKTSLLYAMTYQFLVMTLDSWYNLLSLAWRLSLWRNLFVSSIQTRQKQSKIRWKFYVFLLICNRS